MQSALEQDEALALLEVGHAYTRPSAVAVKSTIHCSFTPLNAGCTPGSSRNAEQQRRPSDAALGRFGEHGVQPALTGAMRR